VRLFVAALYVAALYNAAAECLMHTEAFHEQSMPKRKIILSDSDSEIPPVPSTPDTPPPEPTPKPPSKRSLQRARQQASLEKIRRCEYMRRPEDRSMRKFRAYFMQDELQQKQQQLPPPRTLKRFKLYDSRMQELRAQQRNERNLNAAPKNLDFACHVCGATGRTHFQCQMRISKQKAWRGRPPEGHTGKTWWRKARANAERWVLRADRLRGVFAVLKSNWLQYKRIRVMDERAIALDAVPLDFISDFYNPAAFLLVKPMTRSETSMPSATLATIAFLQECGQYICTDCCVRERMPRNLDLTNNSFCRSCYHRGTRREDYARHEQAQLEHKSLAYRENRPARDEKESSLPKPSTLLTDRSTNALWSGGTGRQLIRREPLNGSAYTHSELNGLLKTVENFFYNRTASFQVMYTVESDNSRPWALTRGECIHHFGISEVRSLMLNFEVDPNDTFMSSEQLARYTTIAEPDEEGDSDCELSD